MQKSSTPTITRIPRFVCSKSEKNESDSESRGDRQNSARKVRSESDTCTPFKKPNQRKVTWSLNESREESKNIVRSGSKTVATNNTGRNTQSSKIIAKRTLKSPGERLIKKFKSNNTVVMNSKVPCKSEKQNIPAGLHSKAVVCQSGDFYNSKKDGDIKVTNDSKSLHESRPRVLDDNSQCESVTAQSMINSPRSAKLDNTGADPALRDVLRPARLVVSNLIEGPQSDVVPPSKLVNSDNTNEPKVDVVPPSKLVTSDNTKEPKVDVVPPSKLVTSDNTKEPKVDVVPPSKLVTSDITIEPKVDVVPPSKLVTSDITIESQDEVVPSFKLVTSDTTKDPPGDVNSGLNHVADEQNNINHNSIFVSKETISPTKTDVESRSNSDDMKGDFDVNNCEVNKQSQDDVRTKLICKIEIESELYKEKDVISTACTRQGDDELLGVSTSINHNVHSDDDLNMAFCELEKAAVNESCQVEQTNFNETTAQHEDSLQTPHESCSNNVLDDEVETELNTSSMELDVCNLSPIIFLTPRITRSNSLTDLNDVASTSTYETAGDSSSNSSRHDRDSDTTEVDMDVTYFDIEDELEPTYVDTSAESAAVGESQEMTDELNKNLFWEMMLNVVEKMFTDSETTIELTRQTGDTNPPTIVTPNEALTLESEPAVLSEGVQIDTKHDLNQTENKDDVSSKPEANNQPLNDTNMGLDLIKSRENEVMNHTDHVLTSQNLAVNESEVCLINNSVERKQDTGSGEQAVRIKSVDAVEDKEPVNMISEVKKSPFQKDFSQGNQKEDMKNLTTKVDKNPVNPVSKLTKATSTTDLSQENQEEEVTNKSVNSAFEFEEAIRSASPRNREDEVKCIVPKVCDLNQAASSLVLRPRNQEATTLLPRTQDNIQPQSDIKSVNEFRNAESNILVSNIKIIVPKPSIRPVKLIFDFKKAASKPDLSPRNQLNKIQNTVSKPAINIPILELDKAMSKPNLRNQLNKVKNKESKPEINIATIELKKAACKPSLSPRNQVNKIQNKDSKPDINIPTSKGKIDTSNPRSSPRIQNVKTNNIAPKPDIKPAKQASECKNNQNVIPANKVENINLTKTDKKPVNLVNEFKKPEGKQDTKILRKAGEGESVDNNDIKPNIQNDDILSTRNPTIVQMERLHEIYINSQSIRSKYNATRPEIIKKSASSSSSSDKLKSMIKDFKKCLAISTIDLGHVDRSKEKVTSKPNVKTSHQTSEVKPTKDLTLYPNGDIKHDPSKPDKKPGHVKKEGTSQVRGKSKRKSGEPGKSKVYRNAVIAVCLVAVSYSVYRHWDKISSLNDVTTKYLSPESHPGTTFMSIVRHYFERH